MLITVNNWPFGYEAAFSLNFDDLSPFHFWGYDFGGALDGILLKQQEELIKNYNVKITHFVVPKSNYFLPLNNKLQQLINFKTNKYALSNSRNDRWLKVIKELIADNICEIAMHGYTHFNNNLRKRHQEFSHYNYDEIISKISKSSAIFKEVNIPIYGFRPPGWGIDSQEILLTVIKNLGYFNYIAASSTDGGLNRVLTNVDNYMPSWYKSLLNIPQNIELDNSINIITNRIDKIVKMGKLISLKGHFTNVKWITNNFNKVNYEKLKIILDFTSQFKIWYATFKEISDYFKAINSVRIDKIHSKTGTIAFNVKNHSKINGLTLTIIFNKYQGLLKEIKTDKEKVLLNSHTNYRVIFNSQLNNYVIGLL